MFGFQKMAQSSMNAWWEKSVHQTILKDSGWQK
jgi:hypothetical protein